MRPTTPSSSGTCGGKNSGWVSILEEIHSFRGKILITVQKINETTFEVTVEGRTTTTHRVTVETDYYDRLTGGKVAPEVLVEKSFEFLPEREQNTSILRTFDLPLIGRYFPEYERTIKGILG